MKTHVTGTAAHSKLSTENHSVVSRDEWVAERQTLLKHEKELTRLRDQVARERRALPWVRIDKTYVFDGPGGRRTLANCWFSTSCSPPAGSRDARAARSWLTTVTA